MLIYDCRWPLKKIWITEKFHSKKLWSITIRTFSVLNALATVNKIKTQLKNSTVEKCIAVDFFSRKKKDYICEIEWTPLFISLRFRTKSVIVNYKNNHRSDEALIDEKGQPQTLNHCKYFVGILIVFSPFEWHLLHVTTIFKWMNCN